MLARLFRTGTVVLSLLSLLTLAGCQGGSPGSSTLTLRVGAQALGNAPLTVFVSRADGSLIDARTVQPGEGTRVFVFTNVPPDALVTGAYKVTKPVWDGSAYVNTEVYRLRTYPVLYADERAFYPNPINEFIGSLTAVLYKPAIAGVASAGGVFPHFDSMANFGSATSVTLNDGLYQSDMQTDGKYSPVFYAYDSNRKPLAYAGFLDQAVDPTNPNATFTVNPGDWRTDLQTVRLTIANYEGNTNPDGSPGGYSFFCPSVVGFRKGVAAQAPYTCEVAFDQTAKKLGFTLSYPPSLFETYGYSTGWLQRDSSKPGRPRIGSFLIRRGLSGLPSEVVLDAKADFLAPPMGFSVAGVGTAQPAFSWASPYGSSTPPSGAVPGVTLRILDLGIRGYDYDWYFDRLPVTTSSLKLPELPGALAGFAPVENGSSRRYSAELTYFEEYPNDAQYKRAYAYRDFASAAPGSARLGPAAGALPWSWEPAADPFAIELKALSPASR